MDESNAPYTELDHVFSVIALLGSNLPADAETITPPIRLLTWDPCESCVIYRVPPTVPLGEVKRKISMIPAVACGFIHTYYASRTISMRYFNDKAAEAAIAASTNLVVGSCIINPARPIEATETVQKIWVRFRVIKSRVELAKRLAQPLARYGRILDVRLGLDNGHLINEGVVIIDRAGNSKGIIPRVLGKGSTKLRLSSMVPGQVGRA